MKNTEINLKVVQIIASALEELNNEVIFVGGATISLYIDDSAALDIRPTKDVDISLSVATFHELEKIREILIQKNFKQTSDLDVICRFKYEDILVDVMNTKEIAWAPANPWFMDGFNNAEIIALPDIHIRIMPFNYFLASKFSAFQNRGNSDPRTSNDFEDITYLLDNRTDWHKLINDENNKKMKSFLISSLVEIKMDRRKQEAVIANLYYETAEERFEKILNKINKLL